MPLIATRGAASVQGFGEFAQSGPVNYIEDVFSTYLYTGNGSTQTITNGIDLSTKGGLVWIKNRTGAQGHNLYDTARGRDYLLRSNSTAAQAGPSGSTNDLTAFNANGFSLGVEQYSNTNDSAFTYASWTFRKQPKFFDVVTYTGNGVAGSTIAHNLGSVPGCIIVKRTDSTSNWPVYHRSISSPLNVVYLNLTTAASQDSGPFHTTPTASVFYVGDSTTNASGGTYVAYLFAHDAGGFGLTGTDNVITCGSFTTDGSGIATVTLGYEPQWVLIKRTNSTSEWHLLDTMRGFSQSTDAWLRANSSAAEDSTYAIATPTATGFVTDGTSIIDPSSTFIYIAIRRGPMKTPTSGTSVFAPVTYTTPTGNTSVNVGFAADMVFALDRSGPTVNNDSRLVASSLRTASTAAQLGTNYYRFTTAQNIVYDQWNFNVNCVMEAFRRAPGFFDVVCYTGTGGTGSRSLSHNLNSTPEFIILKRRDAVSGWQTGSMFTSTTVTRAVLNLNNDQDLNSLYTGQSIWGGQPTSTAFLIDASGSFNTSTATYVAYLFASVAGVSKVGSYTGTGTTLQVNCGFTNGSRFVLIKRTDSTGDWYVWDSARGIVAGNDPYLLLNSTAAEVTNTDYVDTYSAGFEISSTAPAAINANGGTFIFLAIA